MTVQLNAIATTSTGEIEYNVDGGRPLDGAAAALGLFRVGASKIPSSLARPRPRVPAWLPALFFGDAREIASQYSALSLLRQTRRTGAVVVLAVAGIYLTMKGRLA
jgi:hypothetical protein